MIETTQRATTSKAEEVGEKKIETEREKKHTISLFSLSLSRARALSSLSPQRNTNDNRRRAQNQIPPGCVHTCDLILVHLPASVLSVKDQDLTVQVLND
jgi:hypothetical protein